MQNSTPLTFQRILIPTDFSDVSERALEYAKRIAKGSNSQLVLVHVNQPAIPIAPPEAGWIDQDAIFQTLQERLDQNGAELRAEGFQAQAISLTGSLRDEILSFVKQREIDLIVLGTHGKTGLERLLFGSDAETILRHMPCPVLTIGPAAPEPKDPVWHPKDVICATTLDPDSADVAAYAHALARQYDAEFVFFHVGGSKDRRQGDDWLRFEQAFKQRLPADLRVSPLLTVLSDSGPATAIAEVAKKRHSDLIVMGAHAASSLATHVARATAPQVFSEAPCPVLTIQQP